MMVDARMVGAEFKRTVGRKPIVTETNRCTARTKSRNLEPCLNPRAYGCKTCRVHGARKPATILKGKQHPAYKDGAQTFEARAKYSAAASRLRTLEQMMVDHDMVGAEFKRTVGRKPADKQGKFRKDQSKLKS